MSGRQDNITARQRKAKLVFLGVVFTITLAGLMGRVAYIKRVHGSEYERRAIEQESVRRSQETVLTASRGNIYDRNKQTLAISYPVDNVIIDIVDMVKEIKKGEKNDKLKKTMENTITNLSLYLNIPENEIRELLRTDENGVPVKNTRYHILARQVDRKITTELMASGARCVYTEELSRRSYTHGNIVPQVIGFMRGDSSWGLERYYNKELSGTNGKLYRTLGSDDGSASSRQEAVDGYSLVTTIDLVIQQYAEQAVRNASELYPSDNVSTIVMNPKTGEILAMAQYPPFNLNDPSNIDEIGAILESGARDPRFTTELLNLPDEERLNNLNKIWSNFNISSSFEPGSIYKPIVVAAAVEEGVVTASSGFFCPGKKVIYGEEIHCHLKSGHGSQTLTQVLANSCNVGMMEIASQMGSETLYKYHKDFGYGEKTGVDLPAEADFASIQYTAAMLKNPVNLATYSFGQGFTASALQSINSFAALVNGGNLMKPYVVSQVIDAKGNVVKENEPTIHRKVISAETSNYMRTALESVMTDGTGKKAAIPGYAIGGKTGTAQQGIRHENSEDDEYTLSFITYLPAKDPEIIILVALHLPLNYQDGVTSPAYMMNELMQNIIKYKGYLPDYDTPEAQSIHVAKDSVELNDLTGYGTRDATHYLNNLGMDYEIVGNGGTVTSQMPAAGSMVSREDVIYLYVSSGDSEDGEAKLTLVPKVTDISVTQAVDILTKAGLTPVVFGDSTDTAQEQPAEEAPVAVDEGDAAIEEDTDEGGQAADVSSLVVYEQMPSPDARVQPGTEIKLKVTQ